MNKNNSSFSVCDLRLIRMERNSLSYNTEDECHENKSDYTINRFYLFDYFDRLSYIKHTDSFGNNLLNYSDCFGNNNLNFLENPPPASAQLLLSLVQYSEDADICGLDPFEYEGSELPFLALISVSMTNHFETFGNSRNSLRKVSSKHIERYVRLAIKEIRQISKKAVNNIYANRSKAHLPIIKVFQAINTSDFCVAVRSRYIEDAYYIAHNINTANVTRKTHIKKFLSDLRYITFTTIGIEEKCDQKILRDIVNEYRSHVTINNAGSPLVNEPKIVMRLQIQHENNDILSEIAEIIHVDKHGLYGRYDLTVTLNLDDFSVLFSALKAYKFGTSLPKMSNSVFDKWPHAHIRLVKLIYCALCSHQITIMNERVIVDLDSTCLGGKECLQEFQADMTIKTNKARNNDKEYKCISEQLSNLQKKIDALEVAESKLYFGRAKYREAIRQLIELFRTYSNLWYQEDARINGTMFFVQLNYIVRNIDNTINIILELQRLRKSDDELIPADTISTCIDKLIDSIRYSVQMTNNFNKLLQSVNQQTIQAPNYEIQTKIDAEKFIIAYTEFLRQICMSYYSFMSSNTTKNYRKAITQIRANRVFPIFTSDISFRSGIEAATLFITPYTTMNSTYNKKQSKIISELFSKHENTQIVAIGAPNIESLARMFETLPLISHEISHGLELTGEKEQCENIISIICDKLSKYVNFKIFSSLGFNSIMETNGSLSITIENAYRNAFCKIFSDRQALWYNYPTNSLINVIIDFLSDYVIYDGNYDYLINSYSSRSFSDTLSSVSSALKNLFRISVRTVSKDNLGHQNVEGVFGDALMLTADIIKMLDENDIKAKDLSNTLNASKLIVDVRNCCCTLVAISIHSIITENLKPILLKFLRIKESFGHDNELCQHLDKVIGYIYKIRNAMELSEENYIGSDNSYCIGNKSNLEPSDLVEIIQPISIVRSVIDSEYSEVFQSLIYIDSFMQCQFDKHLANEYLSIHSKEFKFKLYNFGFMFQDISNFAIEIAYGLINMRNYICIEGYNGHDHCKDIAQNVYKEIRYQIEHLMETSTKFDDIVIASRASINCISSLGFMSDEKTAIEAINKQIHTLKRDDIEKIVLDSFVLYREVVADLSMCAINGFDPFGFLKFSVDGLCYDTEYGAKPNDLLAERKGIVLAVLLASEDHKVSEVESNGNLISVDASDLLYKVGCYIQRLKDRFERKFNESTLEQLQQHGIFFSSEDLFNFTNDIIIYINRFFDDYMQHLNSISETPVNRKQVLDYSDFTDYFYTKITEYITKYHVNNYPSCISAETENIGGRILLPINRIITRLDYLLKLASNICFNKRIFVDKKLFYHLLELYKKRLVNENKHLSSCSKWEFEWHNCMGYEEYNSSRVAVSEYYNHAWTTEYISSSNTPTCYANRFSGHRMFLDTLSFVLSFYYLNRFNFGGRPSATNEWLNDFTGNGDKAND